MPPRTDSGEVIFVGNNEQVWLPFRDVGKVCLLRTHANGGITVLVDLDAGAVVPEHLHPDGEDLVLLTGRITVNGIELIPGDYLYSPPGSRHTTTAQTASRFVAVLPAPPIYPESLKDPITPS